MASIVMGEDAANLGIKMGRVIHFLAVAELVDDDAVENLRGREKQETVEIQIACRGTASPARALVPNGNFSVIDTDQRRIIGDSFREDSVRIACDLLKLL